MAFQVSPGVNVTEIDLTTVVPAVSTSTAAIAGNFNWGPAEYPTLISTEDQLVRTFGKPTANNFETFFTAADFLAYGNSLYVSRAISSAASKNAVANSTAVVIKNINDYNSATLSASNQYIAKYPGALGNSLKISVCDSNTAYSSGVTGTANYSIESNFSVNANTASVNISRTGVANATSGVVTDATSAYSNFTGQLTSGDYVFVGNSSSIGTQYLQYNTSSIGNTIVTAINITAAGSGYDAGNTFVITVATGGTNATGTVVANSTGYLTGTVTITAAGVLGSSNVNISVANSTGGSGGVGSGQTLTVDTKTTSTLNFKSNYTLSTNSSYYSNSATDSSFTRYWEFYNSVNKAPGTTNYVVNAGGSGDELHVVIADEDGLISGVKGNTLEVFQGLSRATDAVGDQGGSLYYKNVINNSSFYVWWAGDRNNAASATSAAVIASTNTKPLTASFTGGVDSVAESTFTLGDLALALDKFRNTEEIDVSLILTGKSDSIASQANYIIDNICETRKDCVAFVSPDSSLVGNIDPMSKINTFISSLHSSSYAVVDSGYKYRYDKYNDVYRYTPLNGDVAGTAARTDNVRDPWWSPAGFNRGQIKNIVRLAFNPNQAQRDALYKASVNPVVTFPGQGTVLYGDKTFLNRPSAFDRINVRRLFIVLEKAIATAAKFTLFEFNDDFTRSQFRNLVEPFLRDVQGRRGIYDFRVICDDTNNTPEVIDSNRFVGDIYIKPARSINFIQLNFVAVRTGVQFEEIVGRF